MRNRFEHQDNKQKSKCAIQSNEDLPEIKNLSFLKLPAPTLSTNAIQRGSSRKYSHSKNGQDYQIYSNTNATNTQDKKVATNEIAKINGAIPKVTNTFKKPIPAPRSTTIFKTKSTKYLSTNPQVNNSLDSKNDTHFTTSALKTPGTSLRKTKSNGNIPKNLALKTTQSISRTKTQNNTSFDGVDTNNTSFTEPSQFGHLNEFRQSMTNQIAEYMNDIRINGFDNVNTESQHLSEESLDEDDESDISSDQEEEQKYFEDNFPSYDNIEKYDYLKNNIKDKVGDRKYKYKSNNEEEFLEYEVVDDKDTYLYDRVTDSEEEYFEVIESDTEELMNNQVVNTQEDEIKTKNANQYSRKFTKSKTKYHIYENMDECFILDQNFSKLSIEGSNTGTDKLEFCNVPPKPDRSLKHLLNAACSNPDDESDVKYYEPIQVNLKYENFKGSWNENSYGNKQSNKLLKIVQELKETEIRYVQELKRIIPIYKYGLKNHSSLLIQSKAQLICSTIDKLLELQIEFEDMIKNADDLVRTIPQIFMDFEQLFQKYRQCLVENESVIIVPDVKNSKMEISLSSILTHRLVHYKRFLEDIRDEMSRCNPNMFQTILCSLNTLMEILQSCNIMLALAKIQNIPLQVDKNGQSGDVRKVSLSSFVQGCPFDVSGYGDLLLQDKFEVKKHYKGLLTVFLFEKIILLTKEVQKEKFLYQGHIDMDRVRLLHDDRKNILKLEYFNESKQPYKLTYRLKGDPKTIEKWYNKIYFDCLWTQKLVVKEEVTEKYKKTTRKSFFYVNKFLSKN